MSALHQLAEADLAGGNRHVAHEERADQLEDHDCAEHDREQLLAEVFVVLAGQGRERDRGASLTQQAESDRRAAVGFQARDGILGRSQRDARADHFADHARQHVEAGSHPVVDQDLKVQVHPAQHEEGHIGRLRKVLHRVDHRVEEA